MQTDVDEMFKGRIRELAKLSANGNCCMFTDFLNPAEQSYILTTQKSLPASAAFFGGYGTAERVVAKFGSVYEPSYDVPYPITILHITPLNPKFSDKLTHRDFLGAVLNLGIDRKLTGDILTDGTDGWIFVRNHIAGYIEESLTQVRHTSVKAAEAENIPEGIIHGPETTFLTVPSLRLDAVISKAFNISRREVDKLLASEKIFVNSIIRSKASCLLKEGDLISVRGFGRIRYIETSGDTRKGNLKIRIDRY